ncbi:tRNA (guanine-N(7)-)-methyltransferase [Propionispora sp. 2/2-37]|uniref:tRNA (guanosine(46)-N7)-methyltransferase TrmB n=1 Tax=Propionispora sp. 2/2-37 TaxID=1677858 RepID=UPI0006BB86CA|nr:tRNA (guanosine(46)-N7)-methyltransferase TrmB [Propionispora sp. 2/2-37]CUH97592.1 tRNA (guanine-N(7)-)-methyltransferase [Propionispora sp. 2/2-37]
MRLRRKPWIDKAIQEYDDIVLVHPNDSLQGRWQEIFGRTAPLFVELGTGKGQFLAELAECHPEVNFIGIEAQQGVLFYAAQKIRAKALANVRLLVFDINHILDIFAPGEVARFYINFCDPWPKARHAKRRLTHLNFLEKYRVLLQPKGELFFKTDNRALFDFSLEQFSMAGLQLQHITYDLHAPEAPGHEGNIMTEYERKFSARGMRINRVEAKFL